MLCPKEPTSSTSSPRKKNGPLFAPPAPLPPPPPPAPLPI